MNTTLYNHNAAGTEEKPLIPNAEFAKLVSLLKEVKEIESRYLLVPFQRSFIEQLKEGR